MTPKALSAIVLRLFGAWLLYNAVFGFIGQFILQQQLAALAGIHRRWYESTPQGVTTSPDSYLHDTYNAIFHFAPGLAAMALPLIAGIILLRFSKPLARLLAHNLDNF